MAELTKPERIRDALAPLIQKPTKHELNLVAQYKDCVTEYIANKGVTERERKLKSNMNISNFAKLPNTTHSLHFGEGYSKLASSNEFLNDESLHFLQLYMKKLISPEDQEDVCFVRGVATNRLTKDARYAANGAGFPPKRTRRAKHCNDYLSLFANGRKGNEVPSVASYRSIFFPINFDNLHFAGAIAHVRDGDTIYTFDSMDMDQTRSTHDNMFQMVSAVLNHALVYEGKNVRKFVHMRIEVPQQTDTWNCGLFQTANGVQLACADDPTAQAVMNALFKQSEIVKLRTKLPGVVLNECTIYSAANLKKTFKEVTAQVDQGLEEAEKVAKKKRAKLSVTKNATGVEKIDLSNSDDDEEETAKPSSVNKPPGTASSKSKHRTNTQASKQSQPLNQVQGQPSTTKQQSVPSLLKNDPSFKKAVSKKNVDAAFTAALKSACPMTFDNQESVKRVLMLTQPWKDVLRVLSPGSTVIPTHEQVKKVHKRKASDADIGRFCADLQCFMEACLTHCYQMVCFHDLATTIWSKITLSDTNDAFLKDFAKYLVRVVVYGWRANSYLDNGNNIVMQDKQLPQFCSDIIFNSDIKGRVMLLYPTLDYKKMRDSVVFSNLADVTSQTFSAIERQLIDDIIGNVNVVALTRDPDIVAATYQLSSGEQKSVRLESLFVTDSMETYKRSKPSYPDIVHFEPQAFRYSHLRHLHDLFMRADLKVPKYLIDNLRDMFNWSLEKRLIKRKRIHESSDEESSVDESEAVNEMKNESVVASADVETKNASAVSRGGGQKKDDVATVKMNESTTDTVEKDMLPAPVDEKQKDANTATATDEVVDKKDESGLREDTTLVKSTAAVEQASGVELEDATTKPAAVEDAKEDATDITTTAATTTTLSSKSKKKKAEHASGVKHEDEVTTTEGDVTKKFGAVSDIATTAATTTLTSKSKRKKAKGTTAETELMKEESMKEPAAATDDVNAPRAKKAKGTTAETELMKEESIREPAAATDDVSAPRANKGSNTKKSMNAEKNKAAKTATAATATSKSGQSKISNFLQKRLKSSMQSWGDHNVRYTGLESREPRKKKIKLVEDIPYELGGGMNVHIGPPSTGLEIDGDGTGLYTNKDITIDDFEKYTIFRPHGDNAIDVYEYIGKTSEDLRKRIEGMPITRDQNNSIFKNYHHLPAMQFIIDDVDEIDVVDHLECKENHAELLVRMTFPTNENHDLMRELKCQVDFETYNRIVETAKAKHDNDLVLIAFVTSYGSNVAGKQTVVDKLLFHSFILIKKPTNTFEKSMSVSIMWTSDAYSGASLDRLMQIGCLLFWKSPKTLTIDTNYELSSNTIGWKKDCETIACIPSRMVHGKPIWKARSGTKLERAVAAAAFKMAKKVSEMDMSSFIYRRGYLPLAVFTHNLCENQPMTEVAAELLQYVDILQTADGKAYTLKCRCCNKHMLEHGTDLDELLQYTTTIIIQHYFGNINDIKDVNILQALGGVKDGEELDEFGITLCQPTKDRKKEMRKRYYDAYKSDKADDKKDFRHENVLAFSDCIGEIEKVMDVGGNKDMDDSGDEEISALMEKRPIQVQTQSGEVVVPLSQFEADPSWDGDAEDTKSEAPVATLKASSVQVGNRVVEAGAEVFAHEPTKAEGTSALDMLFCYYAKWVVAIPPGMTFAKLAKSVRGLTLPPGLQKYMDTFNITSVWLIVVTDLPKKFDNTGSDDSRNIHQRISHLTANMIKALSFFHASDDFLRLFPKHDVTSLREGKTSQLQINPDLRTKIRRSIELSFKFEIGKIELYAKYPNEIYLVTLTSGKKAFVDPNNEDARQCIQNIQEPWVTERLRSVNYMSTGMGVCIGIGKKQVASRDALSQYSSPAVNGSNFWTDVRNPDDQCVYGAVANWLYAIGFVQEATNIKELASSRHIYSTNEDAMPNVLKYMQTDLQIRNVVINFKVHASMSLEKTVVVFGSFPAPVILEFASITSYQRHAVVVANNRVYDLQDRFPYDMTYSALSKHLNADENGVTLVSARYLYQGGRRERDIPGCPIEPLKMTPQLERLVKSFGANGRKQRRRMKRKRKRKKSN